MCMSEFRRGKFACVTVSSSDSLPAAEKGLAQSTSLCHFASAFDGIAHCGQTELVMSGKQRTRAVEAIVGVCFLLIPAGDQSGHRPLNLSAFRSEGSKPTVPMSERVALTVYPVFVG